MPRDGIKLRDRHRSAGLNDLHSQQTEHPSSRRNLEFSTSAVKYTDELCQLDKNLNDRAALGTSHGGLEGEKDTCTTCVEGQTSKSRLAPVYSPWHEVKESSLLAKAWREKAQEVLRRTRGCGAKATRSTNCKRAGYPPQWDYFRVRREGSSYRRSNVHCPPFVWKVDSPVRLLTQVPALLREVTGMPPLCDSGM